MDQSAGKTAEDSASLPSSSESWKERILYPTILAGLVGGGAGLVSKHRKVHGLAQISATYAANFAIVTGFYCGAREFVRASRKAGPDDLISSAVAGFGTGALLGRLQVFKITASQCKFVIDLYSDQGFIEEYEAYLSTIGGRIGAIRYSIAFAVAGTAADYTLIKVKQSMHTTIPDRYRSMSEKIGNWVRMPDWSPIRVLDEEALAAKRAQEQQLQARIRELRKEGS